MAHADDKILDETNTVAKDNPTTTGDAADDAANTTAPNPPRTTTGRWFTAPKFGSAGSGGAELEPGPERD